MKLFRYQIPKMAMKRGVKPFRCRAWETAKPGLIIQEPSKSREQHTYALTHKHSGFIVRESSDADRLEEIATALRSVPIDFQVIHPWKIHAQLLKMTDEQLIAFGKALGNSNTAPGHYRKMAAGMGERKKFMAWWRNNR